MSTLVRRSALPEIEYPTSDGKLMAETELHGQIMTDFREILASWVEDDPMAYVWGDLLIFYEEGNPRKHLAPDVFMVRGVPKRPSATITQKDFGRRTWPYASNYRKSRDPDFRSAQVCDIPTGPFWPCSA